MNDKHMLNEQIISQWNKKLNEAKTCEEKKQIGDQLIKILHEQGVFPTTVDHVAYEKAIERAKSKKNIEKEKPEKFKAASQLIAEYHMQYGEEDEKF